MSGFKPITTLMRENDVIQPIHDRLNAMARLQLSFADALPDGLKHSCRVAALEGSTLIIAAANGAMAAKLKQMVPRLLDKIRENKKQEQQVTAITVLVQPEFEVSRPVGPKAENRCPPSDGMLSELSESLRDSPLKATIEKLQRKREQTLTNSKKPRNKL